MSTLSLIVAVVGLAIAVLVWLMLSRWIALWFQCRVSGAPIPFLYLIAASIRKTDVRTLAFSHIRLKKSGQEIPVERLEMHMLAGGHLPRTTSALITAHKHGLGMSWDELAQMDLKGEDPLASVRAVIGEGAVGEDG